MSAHTKLSEKDLNTLVEFFALLAEIDSSLKKDAVDNNSQNTDEQ